MEEGENMKYCSGIGIGQKFVGSEIVWMFG